MILSENRSPAFRDHALEAQASIKVDMGEKLLWLVGNYAAGNGSPDHKCVLEYSAHAPAAIAARNNHPRRKCDGSGKSGRPDPREALSGRD
jgi:hypothetical protein